jgi:myo-inositol-1(or 4)-monophosphatase
MARTALLNVMVQAAIKAGRGLSRDFGEVENLQVSLKGPGDFVSAADRRADQTLIAELRKARPSYGFLTEETGTIEGSDGSHRWIIDPLDGTTNFLHGIPVFAVSIALEREGQIVAGVVLNPILNELYVAERGSGAFLNDRRLRVAGRRHLADTVIATGTPHMGKANHAAYLAEMRAVMSRTAGVRRVGAAALDLAWVASGRYDGFWEHGLFPWDMAAGLLLIREAGGFVSDAAGGEDIFGSGSVVAGNEAIHGQLLGLLEAAAIDG